jgi:hypothetical protein
MPEETLKTAAELAQMADLWFATRAKRLDADKVAAALKTEESALEASIIDQMLKSQLSAVGGKSVITFLPEPKLEPVKKDWAAFWAYVMETGDSSLIEQRVGRAAIKERWANGETIPGVASFPVYRLTRTKPK